MEKFLEQFNETTDNKYAFLQLSEVKIYARKGSCDFIFLYPAAYEPIVLDNRETIESALKKAIRSPAEVHIKLKKSHFDFDFFKADFFAFLSAYPMLSGALTDKDVVCGRGEDDTYELQLSMPESVCEYCERQEIRKDIEDFLDTRFCEPIRLRLTVRNEANVTTENIRPVQSNYALERPDEGRLIRPQNVEDFIGKIIYEPAGYIEDASVKESAVLCGTISKIYEQARKPKEGELAPRKFFKFLLEDFTGNISCVYFPTKKTVDQFGLLQAGKQIVARGKITEDTYRGNGALSFMVRDICLCTLPQDFVPNKVRRRVPDSYTKVFPEPYVKKAQASLFDVSQVEQSIPSFVRNKTFVVFDIETTGFNTEDDKIIEIGAVKLQDGKVTETFSTFIDPHMPIPERIVKLTHIEDSDVRGQPNVEEALLDFYKFTDGAILVGQNVQFDHGFIQAKGGPLHLQFDHTLMDTLSLAKTYYPGLKNYKLGTLAKYFGVVNKGAHRAVYDAWATMEIFMKLVEKLS